MLPRVLQSTPAPPKLTSASVSALSAQLQLSPDPLLLVNNNNNNNVQNHLHHKRPASPLEASLTSVLRPMNQTSPPAGCGKPQLAKLCRVCGDVALGFNFNGLSCESCKAFFRRNAVKNKVFKCRKNGNCHIDKVSRKYCKRCRLEKCYAIGMKKELIWSCRELVPVRNHNTNSGGAKSNSDDSNEENSKNAALTNNERNNIINNLIHNITNNASSTQHTTTNTNNINDQNNIFVDNVNNYTNNTNNVRYSERNVELVESSMALDVIRLRQYDIMRLQEVRSAMLNFKDESSLEVVGNADSLLDVMNLAELYVKKIITFCKNFSAFTCLKLADQLIMLKSFHPEIGAIGASFLYNSKRDGLPVIANRHESKAVFVKLDHSDELKNKEIVQIFRKFLQSMQIEMESDVAIRDLILAQLLFAPRENVSCPEFLKYNHAVYCHLLRRYLEHKYKNPMRAEEKYSALMRMLKQINSVSQCFREVYLNEVDINKVAKILAEIYNLI